jgi:dienelactone hydrolase
LSTSFRSSLACLILVSLPAGCGSQAKPKALTTAGPDTRGSSQMPFGYDASAPLHYHDRGRTGRAGPIEVHDVSFASGRERIEGYLVLPPSRRRRPAVVFVHGSGGDRGELLEQARWLAARGVVTLTITEPSTSSPPAATAAGPLAVLRRIRDAQVRDVVAIRRAVDLLRSLPRVDPRRIGYLGWSAGAKAGALVAASEPRIKAFVLLSAGADPLAAFVAQAPPSLRPAVRSYLGSVDPIRFIAKARPGSVLLEDGRQDEIVPRAALLNIVRAAPKGTTVRWYDASHALGGTAYHDAFNWLTRKLPIDGPGVAGAATESSGHPAESVREQRH